MWLTTLKKERQKIIYLANKINFIMKVKDLSSWTYPAIRDVVEKTMNSFENQTLIGTDAIALSNPFYIDTITTHAIHESGRGLQSGLAKKHNNIFGMGRVHHRPNMQNGFVTMTDNLTGVPQDFGVYDSIEDAIICRLQWDNYRAVNFTDVRGYLEEIQTIPYAGDKKFVPKVIALYEEFNNEIVGGEDQNYGGYKVFTTGNLLTVIGIGLTAYSIFRRR